MNDAELTQRVIAASGPPTLDDLATFLRKRLTAARQAESSKRSIPGNLGVEWAHHLGPDEEYVLLDGRHRVDAEEFWETHGEPAADPSVLADLDSKLKIVELCDSETGETGGLSLARRTLRLLGLPYATHPDYKENWRP